MIHRIFKITLNKTVQKATKHKKETKLLYDHITIPGHHLIELPKIISRGSL